MSSRRRSSAPNSNSNSNSNSNTSSRRNTNNTNSNSRNTAVSKRSTKSTTKRATNTNKNSNKKSPTLSWEDILSLLYSIQIPHCGVCNVTEDTDLLMDNNNIKIRKRRTATKKRRDDDDNSNSSSSSSDEESDDDEEGSDKNEELLSLPPCGCELRLIDIRKVSKVNQNILKGVLTERIRKEKEKEHGKESDDDSSSSSSSDELDDKEEKLKSTLMSSNLSIRVCRNSILCRRCLSEMVRVSSDILEVDYNDSNPNQGRFTVEPKCVQCKTRYTPRKINSVLDSTNKRSEDWIDTMEFTYLLCHVRKYLRKEGLKGKCNSNHWKDKEDDATDNDNDNISSITRHILAPEKGEVLHNLLNRDPKFRQEYEDKKYIETMLASERSNNAHHGTIMLEYKKEEKEKLKNLEEEDRKYAIQLQNDFRHLEQRQQLQQQQKVAIAEQQQEQMNRSNPNNTMHHHHHHHQMSTSAAAPPPTTAAPMVLAVAAPPSHHQPFPTSTTTFLTSAPHHPSFTSAAVLQPTNTSSDNIFFTTTNNPRPIGNPTTPQQIPILVDATNSASRSIVAAAPLQTAFYYANQQPMRQPHTIPILLPQFQQQLQQQHQHTNAMHNHPTNYYTSTPSSSNLTYATQTSTPSTMHAPSITSSSPSTMHTPSTTKSSQQQLTQKRNRLQKHKTPHHYTTQTTKTTSNPKKKKQHIIQLLDDDDDDTDDDDRTLKTAPRTNNTNKSKSNKPQSNPLQYLTSMGFKERDAIMSLDNAKGDLELAVSMLISMT